MNIDLINERDWISVIDGTRAIHFEFLGLQLLLVTLRNRLHAKELTPQDCIRELKAFYRKFNRLPLAERDFRKIGHLQQPSMSHLMSPDDVARKIASGESLMLAGDEALLATLPPGKWIGGTIPYFMAQDGGCLCKDKIFATEFPIEFETQTQRYSQSDLRNIYQDGADGVLTFAILPANCPTHLSFALHATQFPGFALHPLVGWVAGVDLARMHDAKPKVFCGTPTPLEDAAAVMRVKLPSDHLPQINIINLFKPGDGDTIYFPTPGLSATAALINGQEENFARYLQRIEADTRLPLVANYHGANVNVSLKSVDPKTGIVEFYAPVISQTGYKLAKPIRDYVSQFETALRKRSPGHVLFSCNCILNYFYSKLEGCRTGALVGPATFGEIAYQLLNQTAVYVEVVKAISTTSPGNATPLELSAAHQELQASELRFQTLSDSAPLGIFITDKSGRGVYENAFCTKVRGATNADPGNWMKSIHPTDLPGTMAAIKESDQTGCDFDHEFRFVKPDGKICWIHSKTAFLRSETGEIIGRLGTLQDITERKLAENHLEQVHRDLVRASRDAGIAEVTTGVLHNVKNVLNSINVSASVIADRLQKSKSPSLAKVTAMLREHATDLGAFLTTHPKGKLVPGFLDELAKQLIAERDEVLKDLQQLEKNLQHIKDVVSIQQTCAKRGGALEKVRPVDLVEDSLQISSSSLARHGIQVVREYEENLPEISVEKHSVLQIIVNFITNAKHACKSSDRPDKKLILRVTNSGDFIDFAVVDNGIGIPPENLKRVFEHGFTTKKEGHGFGLHSGALAVKELGGEIQVHSDGAGRGATFTVRLPVSRTAQ